MKLKARFYGVPCTFDDEKNELEAVKGFSILLDIAMWFNSVVIFFSSLIGGENYEPHFSVKVEVPGLGDFDHSVIQEKEEKPKMDFEDNLRAIVQLNNCFRSRMNWNKFIKTKQRSKALNRGRR